MGLISANLRLRKSQHHKYPRGVKGYSMRIQHWQRSHSGIMTYKTRSNNTVTEQSMVNSNTNASMVRTCRRKHCQSCKTINSKLAKTWALNRHSTYHLSLRLSSQ